ncbi:MAG: hypothetical protein NTY67_05060 [Cyanobacteria bacterium]|nr:hypothetical protein [Cyanobacteriota bacterium]
MCDRLLGPASSQGQLALNTSGSYGDLNGDGRLDFLAADTPTTLYGVNQQSWAFWSIRAAGDVNGNGVDDVMLSLAPQGPAYGQVTAGQPSALLSVLVDGSLFKVDKANNSFRLDQLRTPLNPYNRSQLYDVASTSSSDYLPSLQNWFEPILNFKPGSLTAASTATSINPGGARSFTAPAVAISPDGGAYLVISGADTSGPNGASGLWMAYQQAGSWKQTPQLPVGTDASSYSPSATFYQGKLYIAYRDTSGNLHIAYSDDSPENTSATNWHSYQVKTTDNNNNEINESTYSSPTLVAEAGRLALYFPSNSSGTSLQNLLYLYSTDPDNSRSGSNAYGNWGRSLNTTSGGYKGNSNSIDTGGHLVSAPIAATTFQGRTVLAFRSSDSKNIRKGHIFLLTQVSSAPTWKLTDTGIENVNGVALTSDQSLLYLTSSSKFEVTSPSSNILSLRPNTDGTWTPDSQQTVGGSPSVTNGYVFSPLIGNVPTYAPGYGVINPFLSGGQLMVAWTDSSSNIQVADFNATITTPSQQSLAGYSIDGNIDINGDGFKDVLISDPSDPTQSVDNQYALFGGDYLNIASQVGTPGDDVMIGTPLADVIYTLQGADQVNSNGGKDVIYTGAGDDSISIKDNAFIRIDAGSGFDSLQLEGNADQRYDFTGPGSVASLWAPVANSGTSNQSPAMVRDGNTIYMSRRGLDSCLYWTQSTDSGQSWADWQQLPKGITSNNAPSLAVVGGDLYLAYVGADQSVYVTQYDPYSNQWNADPAILYQDTQYSPPTATKVKNGSGQLAAITETVNGAEGLAIYYVDAMSGDVFRQYNNGFGLGFVDLYNPAYWETSSLFPATGSLSVTEYDGSTCMAIMDGLRAYVYSPEGSDPAVGYHWRYLADQDIGNTYGISLSSIPKGNINAGLLLNATDTTTKQQVTSLLADAIPNSAFVPFSSRSSVSDSANPQTATILAIPATGDVESSLLEAVVDSSRADLVYVSNPSSVSSNSGIFCGTQLQNIELINSIDYGANNLAFDAAAVNAINPDRVLFVIPDSSDTIHLSQEFQLLTTDGSPANVSYGGSLWSPYAASAQANPTGSKPALVCVLNPNGAAASDWLSTHVLTDFANDNPNSTTSLGAVNVSREAQRTDSAATERDLPTLPSPQSVISGTTIADGLQLQALRSAPGSPVARFQLLRNGDASRACAVLYCVSTKNSSAQPGLDCIAVAGLIVFQPNETSREITVPLLPHIQQLRQGSVSLEVLEVSYSGQHEQHLLLDTVSSNSDVQGTILSGLQFNPSDDASSATLTLRADTTGYGQDLASLQLRVGRRSSASSSSVLDTRVLALLDANASATTPLPAVDLVTGDLRLDHDGISNQQVSASLQVAFKAADGSPAVTIDAPELVWDSPLRQSDPTSLTFSQNLPLISWRSDDGTGLVSFGLSHGNELIWLLQQAQAGATGSINPSTLAPGDPSSSWLASEGKPVGSRSVLTNPSLAGSTWTPVAFRDGVSLALQILNISGNQFSASFAGGVSVVGSLSTIATAPAPALIQPQLTIRCLASWANGLGLFATDGITGAIGRLQPGDDGYREAALARSKASNLYLSADQLPGYGSEKTYTDLPLDPRQTYGMLLAPGGDISKLYTSFAASNPGGLAQAITLSSTPSIQTLGFEDQPMNGGNGDNDFNDITASFSNFRVALF